MPKGQGGGGNRTAVVEETEEEKKKRLAKQARARKNKARAILKV